MMIELFSAYVFLINLALFAVMGIDKYKARNGLWRIPEKTLFGLALLGGSIGGILGMKVFRHKTKHNSFKIGFPAILILQLTVLGYLGLA